MTYFEIYERRARGQNFRRRKATAFRVDDIRRKPETEAKKMIDYKIITDFFDEYIIHYQELLSFELTKLDMINKNDIETLSGALPREQALIMKTDSFEARRIKLLGEDAGKSFPQIIEMAPVEYKEKLSQQRKVISSSVMKIKEINDIAGVIVAERLKRIKRRIGESGTYNGRGGVKRDSASLSAISKSV